MKRFFIYTDIWTLPIDAIETITYDSEGVSVGTAGHTYYVRPSYCINTSPKDEYEKIQRQLAEAEI
jgi:hypothetical protein